MAVLKKFRTRWWSQSDEQYAPEKKEKTPTPSWGASYDIRPLTVSQLDECWRLDQRCFIDGEAYSRETFDYLLTAPESVSYRAVTAGGVMAGFVIGLVEPDQEVVVDHAEVAEGHLGLTMIKRAIYLGLAVVSAWQFVSAVNRYRIASNAARARDKRDLATWEGEGGNPAPVRRRVALRH